MSAESTPIAPQPGRAPASRGAGAAPRQHAVVCLGGDRTALEERPITAPGAGDWMLVLRRVQSERE